MSIFHDLKSFVDNNMFAVVGEMSRQLVGAHDLTSIGLVDFKPIKSARRVGFDVLITNTKVLLKVPSTLCNQTFTFLLNNISPTHYFYNGRIKSVDSFI